MCSGVERKSQPSIARGALVGPLVLMFALLLGQGGCSFRSTETSPAPTATTATRPPEPTRTPSPTPTPAARVNPTAPITLTVWLPPEMALPGEEHPGYQVVTDWDAEFLAAHPRVRLESVPKAAYGPGGIVSMVLATQPVAPGRLPDVIAFDTAELSRLSEAGVLQPLGEARGYSGEARGYSGEALSASLWEGMYPFALEAVTHDGRRLAVPFQADIDILVYDLEAMEARGYSGEEPPSSWETLLTPRQEGEGAPPTYVFPATGSDGSAADAFMVHYLALGGRLTEENGRPYLDSGIAARVLRSYRGAMDAGVLPDAVRRMRTREECWASFLGGEAQMASVATHLYHRERASLEGSGYARLPTVGGKPTVVARSWAWGVTTDDPVRQELAVQYIATALTPERAAAWGAATGYLPTQRSVLPAMIEDAAYRRFVDEQLEQALPYPNLSDYGAIQAAVVRAIEDVLDGLATPERAAVTAATAVVRLRPESTRVRPEGTRAR